MPLSNDLISQFVRMTRDTKKTSNEATVYGTVIGTEGENAEILGVRLDGSDVITPVMTTTEYNIGERVAVRIKDHTATVTGNISSPAARTDTVTEKVGVVDKRVTEEVKAINNLAAENLNATNAEIKNLKAEDASIRNLVAENLNATNASIDTLTAGVADINTLIFGSATGETIQAEFSNSVIAQVGEAQIKDAMIDSVTAGKITAGSIDTSKVTITSKSGNFVIADNTLQIKDDQKEPKVRVQIGKEQVAEGETADYSVIVCNAEGKVIFNSNGITEDGVPDGIIRDDMVSDDANISAGKLDIGSLFTKINEDGSNTIKSNKILLDEENQTLDVSFKEMTTKVNGVQETVTSQGEQISVIDGKINSTVWQQEIVAPHIAEAIEGISVGGTNLLSDSHKQVENTNYPLTSFKYADVTRITSGVEYTVSFDGMLSDTTQTHFYINTFPDPYTACVHIPAVATDGQYHRYEATFTMPENKDRDGNVAYTHLGVYVLPAGNDKLAGVKNIKLELGNKATDWTPAPEDTENAITELTTKYSDLTQDVNGFKATVESDYAKLTDVSTSVENAKSAMTQTINGFKTEVSNTYATKGEIPTDYVTKLQYSSLVQDVNSFRTTVSSTYATKDSLSGYATNGNLTSAVATAKSELTQTINTVDAKFTSVNDKVSHITIGTDENYNPYMSMTTDLEIGQSSGFKWGLRGNNGNMGLTWKGTG